MGKASRRKRAEDDTESRDLKVVRQVMRRLDIPDSRCTLFQFFDRVRAVIGDDGLKDWIQLQEDSAPDAQYEFTYSTLDRALNCAVGWRSFPLEQECAWMLPRLRDALAACEPESQFVVEIGAGPGAASAILSAALGVPFLALDPHPLTDGLAEQIAEKARGDVTSIVAGAADLTQVLDGRVPAAVIGMGVFRYFQPHSHQDGSFSFSNSISGFIKASSPASDSVDFFNSIFPADLLLSEAACTDYVGEVAAAGAAAGYYFVEGGLTQLPTIIPSGPTENTLMHLAARRLEPCFLPLLVENYSPLPAPRPGLVLDGPAAEALMVSLEAPEILRLTELRWKNGTSRRAVFHHGDLFGIYTASTLAYRELTFHSAADWPEADAAALAWELENTQAGGATRSVLALPISAW